VKAEMEESFMQRSEKDITAFQEDRERAEKQVAALQSRLTSCETEKGKG
jgi:ubiquinone biosynthesis protein UbiJ